MPYIWRFLDTKTRRKMVRLARKPVQEINVWYFIQYLLFCMKKGVPNIAATRYSICSWSEHSFWPLSWISLSLNLRMWNLLNTFNFYFVQVYQSFIFDSVNLLLLIFNLSSFNFNL
jgi:hypothetical protein